MMSRVEAMKRAMSWPRTNGIKDISAIRILSISRTSYDCNNDNGEENNVEDDDNIFMMINTLNEINKFICTHKPCIKTYI